MRKFLYKTALITAVLFLSSAATKADNLVRNQQKVYKVQKGHTLNIDTRHSNINIVKNTTDEVEINYTISVEGNSRKDQQLFENVEIIIEQKGEVISIKADLPDKLNLDDLEIDFKIKAPSYINVETNLKYGNMFIEELQGKADLKIKYGTFKSDLLASTENKLYMAYMDNVRIGYLNGALVDFRYSEISIKKVTTLSGRSAYSEYQIGEVDEMNISMTKYDEWEISEVLAFSGTARYSEFYIGYLKKAFILDASFGEVDVSATSGQFDKIELDANYTECELNIENGASYHLKVEASYADISYPEADFKGKYHKKMLSLEIDGTVGSNPKGTVIIDTRYGDVEL